MMALVFILVLLSPLLLLVLFVNLVAPIVTLVQELLILVNLVRLEKCFKELFVKVHVILDIQFQLPNLQHAQHAQPTV